MPLTAEQELFVREYPVDVSPADAYLRAGYRAADRDVASKASSRLLKNVEVSRAIELAQQERRERLDLDGDHVGPLRPGVEEGGSLSPPVSCGLRPIGCEQRRTGRCT